MLVNAKIRRYVSFGRYNDNQFAALFEAAGIEFDLEKRPTSRISYLA
jgi:dCMP deaminase